MITGITEIDQQHMQFADLIHSLSKIVTDKSNASLASVIFDIQNCALNHFREEEAHMVKHGYPYVDTHAQEHKYIRDQFSAMAASDSNSLNIADRLSVLLTSWLIEHISGPDSEYGVWLRHRAERF